MKDVFDKLGRAGILLLVLTCTTVFAISQYSRVCKQSQAQHDLLVRKRVVSSINEGYLACKNEFLFCQIRHKLLATVDYVLKQFPSNAGWEMVSVRSQMVTLRDRILKAEADSAQNQQRTPRGTISSIYFDPIVTSGSKNTAKVMDSKTSKSLKKDASKTPVGVMCFDSLGVDMLHYLWGAYLIRTKYIDTAFRVHDHGVPTLSETEAFLSFVFLKTPRQSFGVGLVDSNSFDELTGALVRSANVTPLRPFEVKSFIHDESEVLDAIWKDLESEGQLSNTTFQVPQTDLIIGASYLVFFFPFVLFGLELYMLVMLERLHKKSGKISVEEFGWPGVVIVSMAGKRLGRSLSVACIVLPLLVATAATFVVGLTPPEFLSAFFLEDRLYLFGLLFLILSSCAIAILGFKLPLVRKLSKKIVWSPSAGTAPMVTYPVPRSK